MAADVVETLDEDRRAFIVGMLQMMPEAVSQAMLAEEPVRAALGLPVGGSLVVLDNRFEWAPLAAALRAVANGGQPDLRSVNGGVAITEGRLEPDGSAVLIAGEAGARFASVGLLSDDPNLRTRTLDALIAREDLDADDEGRLRSTVAAGALDDDGFVAVEELVEATSKATYRRLHAAAAEGTRFDELVPADRGHYRRLLAIEPPATLAEFRAAWLNHHEGLDAVRQARLVALAAPLAMLRGDLLPQAAQGVERDERLRLVRFLAAAADPFSRLAAFQIAAADLHDADFRREADAALPGLLGGPDRKGVPGASALCDAVILTATTSAQRGTMEGWPVYARRLAWHLHAGLLLRALGDGLLDEEQLRAAVGRPLEGNYRLVELCDAREAPFGLWAPLTAARLSAVATARAIGVVEDLTEEDCPAEWASAARAAADAAAGSADALFMLAPGPLDPFEQDWAGQIPLTDDQIDEMASRLGSGDDDERALNDVLHVAVAYEVDAARRSDIAGLLPAIAERVTDASHVPAIELSLQLTARWKLPDIADRLVGSARQRSGEGRLTDPGASARFGLLAAAAAGSADEWSAKVGEHMVEFAYLARPGPHVRNLLIAIDLISDFAPTLAPRLIVARSFALLADDGAPSRDPKPEDVAEDN